MTPFRSTLWEALPDSAVLQANLQFPNVPILQYLYRKHNAPFDMTDIELAKTPVFMRNYRYGTSPDYVRKRTSNKPEMMVGLKLYAGN